MNLSKRAPAPRGASGLKFKMGYAASYSLGYAILALLVVNLLGLSFVTLRAVFRWIAGYKPAP